MKYAVDVAHGPSGKRLAVLAAQQRGVKFVQVYRPQLLYSNRTDMRADVQA
jgi:hypothetical protein